MLLYHVLFTGTIKNTFSVLGTLHGCMLHFLKKKLRRQKLCSARLLRRDSSVSEPNIRLTLKPNRRQKSASVSPNRGPSLRLLA